MKDQRYKLKVHVGVDPYQISLRGIELNLISLVKFTMNGIFLTINSYLIDCSLGIVPPRFLP